MDKRKYRIIVAGAFILATAILLFPGCFFFLGSDEGSSEVYAGGCRVGSSGHGEPGYWKNGTWKALPLLDVSEGGLVNSLVKSGSNVFSGGYCVNSSHVDVGCYWENGTRADLAPLDVTTELTPLSSINLSYF